MVNILDGDLFEAAETYIVHQVNCCGVMGNGVALQVKKKYPNVYRRYSEYCDSHRVKDLIGRVLVVPTAEGKVVCNLFAQERFGHGRQFTDIAALRKAMSSLAKIIPTSEAIAMPYLIGCSNGGADWNTVYQIIQDVFKRHSVALYKKD